MLGVKAFGLVYSLLCMTACSENIPTGPSDSLEQALTSTRGNPLTGQSIFIHRDKGHCILCHSVAGLEAEFQGNIGPSLSTVGTRLSTGQIRLRLVDYDRVKPGALMPSYFRKDALNQVGQDYQNQTLLSAQDIEDLIAYLKTLKTETHSEE